MVIKSGRIKIFVKCITNALSNPINYQFLMKVLMKVPRMKRMFNTVVRHHNRRTSVKTCKQTKYRTGTVAVKLPDFPSAQFTVKPVLTDTSLKDHFCQDISI